MKCRIIIVMISLIFQFQNGERINAHKLILTLFSPVFEAEFFGILNQVNHRNHRCNQSYNLVPLFIKLRSDMIMVKIRTPVARRMIILQFGIFIWPGCRKTHRLHKFPSTQDGEILITDIDPEIFRMLLGYLYTSIPLDVKDKARRCHVILLSQLFNLWMFYRKSLDIFWMFFRIKVYIYFHRTLTVRKHGTFGTLRRNISCLSSPSRANQKFNSTLIFPWYTWKYT